MKNSKTTPKSEPSPSVLDQLWAGASTFRHCSAAQRSETESKAKDAQSQFVADATRDTFTWVTGHTKTYNEHWKKERRPFAEEHFPPYDYFRAIFALLDAEEIVWIEKSRDLMVSWACVAYLTLQAMKTPYCGILLQTQKDDKVIQLVDYSKHLYRLQDPRIKRQYPLAKPVERQPDHALHFANGSYIIGIPGGADQIRSYHPWGYLNDESSFQPDAGECYNEAISAVAGKIIFNSSAGPGWYADARRDIVRNEDY